MTNLAFLFSVFRLALRQVFKHKVRSFLTILGILIGVGGVVTIVSLGEGLREVFKGNMASMASNDVIFVMPDAPMEPGRVPVGIKLFKARDKDAIEESENVESVIGGNIMNNALVKHGWRSANMMVYGSPWNYFPIDNLEIDYGRLYTRGEEMGRAMVCVVGAELKKELYDEQESIVDSFITINGSRYRVIGVLKSKSAMTGGGQFNKSIHIPMQTASARLFGNDEIYWMSVKLTEGTDLQKAKEDISARLRASRRIRSGKDDDFALTTPDDWAKFANTFVNSLILVFGVIAMMALVVGGIGVMNIMLVSVQERTREIGLRKALGATPGTIAIQFLVESVTLTLVGGMLGIGIGYAQGGIVAIVMKNALDVFWQPSVPPQWILIVIVAMLVMGLGFGVYPAWRAGRLDPIIALRYE